MSWMTPPVAAVSARNTTGAAAVDEVAAVQPPYYSGATGALHAPPQQQQQSSYGSSSTAPPVLSSWQMQSSPQEQYYQQSPQEQYYHQQQYAQPTQPHQHHEQQYQQPHQQQLYQQQMYQQQHQQQTQPPQNQQQQDLAHMEAELHTWKSHYSNLYASANQEKSDNEDLTKLLHAAEAATKEHKKEITDLNERLANATSSAVAQQASWAIVRSDLEKARSDAERVTRIIRSDLEKARSDAEWVIRQKEQGLDTTITYLRRDVFDLNASCDKLRSRVAEESRAGSQARKDFNLVNGELAQSRSLVRQLTSDCVGYESALLVVKQQLRNAERVHAPEVVQRADSLCSSDRPHRELLHIPESAKTVHVAPAATAAAAVAKDADANAVVPTALVVDIHDDLEEGEITLLPSVQPAAAATGASTTTPVTTISCPAAATAAVLPSLLVAASDQVASQFQLQVPSVLSPLPPAPTILVTPMTCFKPDDETKEEELVDHAEQEGVSEIVETILPRPPLAAPTVPFPAPVTVPIPIPIPILSEARPKRKCTLTEQRNTFATTRRSAAIAAASAIAASSSTSVAPSCKRQRR